MRRLLVLLAALPLLAAAPVTVAGMKNARRVLILAAPSAADPRLVQQQRALARWRGGRDRDVSVVEVIGDRVRGSGDRARLLRRQWHLPPGDFQVVLVGKDGHEALRRRGVLPAAALRKTIDAMPMRRAGRH